MYIIMNKQHEYKKRMCMTCENHYDDCEGMHKSCFFALSADERVDWIPIDWFTTLQIEKDKNDEMCKDNNNLKKRVVELEEKYSEQRQEDIDIQDKYMYLKLELDDVKSQLAAQRLYHDSYAVENDAMWELEGVKAECIHLSKQLGRAEARLRLTKHKTMIKILDNAEDALKLRDKNIEMLIDKLDTIQSTWNDIKQRIVTQDGILPIEVDEIDEMDKVFYPELCNNELIAALFWYQQQEGFHPLTCGFDSTHGLLIPRIKGKDVVLECPTCGTIQTKIPKGIVELHDEYLKNVE
jgi:hypothetical protein